MDASIENGLTLLVYGELYLFTRCGEFNNRTLGVLKVNIDKIELDFIKTIP